MMPILKVSNELKIHPVIVYVLHKRGITDVEDINRFLFPNFSHLPSPFLLQDVKKAITLLRKIPRGSKVLVYGDPDVDGITATSLLVEFLVKLGYKVRFYIPYRLFDDHGIKLSVIKHVVASGYKAVFIVDCGLYDVEAVDYIKKNNIPVFLFDHHKIDSQESVANPDVLVHPIIGDAVWDGLSSVGVVWVFISAFLGKWYYEGLDLLLLGMLADVVPVIGPNRVLLKTGFSILKRTKRRGLKTLMSVLNVSPKNLSWKDVVFRLIPRLNALCKLGIADEAVSFLLMDNKKKANDLVYKMEMLNRNRKKLVDNIVKDVVSIVQQDKPFRPVVIYNSDWNPTIVGTAANKLSALFDVPVALFASIKDQYLKGSVRIPQDYPVKVNDVFGKCDFALKCGGHEKAGGITIHKRYFDEFKTIFENTVVNLPKNGELSGQNILRQNIYTDASWNPKFVDSLFVYSIKRMFPFGIGNPAPLFLFRKARFLYYENKAFYKKLCFSYFKNNVKLFFDLFEGKSFYVDRLIPNKVYNVIYTVQPKGEDGCSFEFMGLM